MLTDEVLTKEEITSIYENTLDVKSSVLEFARDIERAVLAKAMQGGADSAFESHLETFGGPDTNAWHDAPVDGVFKAGFAAGQLAMPIPKQEPRGQNRYGLDMSHMVGKLNILIRDIDNYKGDEAARTLLRLAKVADESVFSGPEFSQPAQAAAIPTGWGDEWKNNVMRLWACARKHDSSIPDDQLDFMRNILLSASPKPE